MPFQKPGAKTVQRSSQELRTLSYRGAPAAPSTPGCGDGECFASGSLIEGCDGHLILCGAAPNSTVFVLDTHTGQVWYRQTTPDVKTWTDMGAPAVNEGKR